MSQLLEAITCLFLLMTWPYILPICKFHPSFWAFKPQKLLYGLNRWGFVTIDRHTDVSLKVFNCLISCLRCCCYVFCMCECTLIGWVFNVRDAFKPPTQWENLHFQAQQQLFLYTMVFVMVMDIFIQGICHLVCEFGVLNVKIQSVLSLQCFQHLTHFLHI